MIKNSSLKKCISELLFQKNISILLSHSKIAPSKNVFQNCYKLSIGNKNQNPVDLNTQDV